MERFSGFDGDDDESGGNGDFTFNVDGTNNDADHRPSTPRSKHSAMEQRRRSKINERFQVLRELIPHSDQKRDKASLLLEVIEHIRTLHEKVQKYESSYPGPGWIAENAKSMPWGEVYFRSCWKNAQNNSPCPGDGIVDPSQDVQNGSLSPGFILLRNDNSTPISVPSVAQNLIENDINAGVSYKAAENTSGFAREVATSSVPHPNLYASVSMIDGVSQSQQLISDADNMASLSDTPWLRSPFLPDCPLIDDTLNGDEMGIDEGTISVSCAYSNGLLTTLSRTLQSSGIDLSQASISVDINLGKRATSRRPSVTTTMSTAKDPKDPSSGQQVVGHSRVGSSGEDTEEAYKRHKSENIQC